MKKLVLISIQLFLFAVLMAAESRYTDIFNNGIEAYTQGEYEQALTHFQQIESEGIHSAELYYNIGNTYFKQTAYPFAILYYEKAHKLAPDNVDISFNLELANNYITDKIEPLPTLFYKNWYNQLAHLFKADNWAWVTIALSFGFAFLLVLYYLSNAVETKKSYFYSAIVTVLLTVFAFMLGNHQKAVATSTNTAIIFTPSVNVKSSPAGNSTDLFVIHEGTKVFVKQETNDWAEITLADGNIGWIKTSDFVRI